MTAETPTRAGGVAAMVMAAVGAVVTLLILATAGYTVALFAADDELGSLGGWAPALSLAAFGGLSGVATVYIGRRGMRELRRAATQPASARSR
ncbi:hypothetical protein ACTMTJ_32945 [Phytohabitans sp. LJ34]|uniref:hypothetical protein n=1 Tax=Phytohabitans sp. LJ34 TaxID=3452217 RepID=UPI003F88CFE2